MNFFWDEKHQVHPNSEKSSILVGREWQPRTPLVSSECSSAATPLRQVSHLAQIPRTSSGGVDFLLLPVLVPHAFCSSGVPGAPPVMTDFGRVWPIRFCSNFGCRCIESIVLDFCNFFFVFECLELFKLFFVQLIVGIFVFNCWIFFCFSLGVFSWNFGGVFEGPSPKMCTFGLSGCRVKPRRPGLVGPPGFHTTAREPKRAQLMAPGASNTTKIPRKRPQRDIERAKRWRDREKRARNFGPITLRGSTLWKKPTLANRICQSIFLANIFGVIVDPEVVGPRGWGPARVGGPKFRAFFSLSRLSMSLWGLFRGILVVFEAPGAINCARLGSRAVV